MSYAFAAGGRWLVTTTPDKLEKRLFCWEVASGRRLEQFGGHYNRWPGQVAFSPDAKLVVCAGWTKPWEQGEYILSLHDAASGRLLRRLPVEDDPTGRYKPLEELAFSPDGKVVAGWDKDCAVQLWHVATGKPVLGAEQSYHPVHRAVFTPDGHSVLTVVTSESAVRQWDAATGKQLRRLHNRSWDPEVIALSPNGKTLAIPSIQDDQHRLSIIDLASGETSRDFPIEVKHSRQLLQFNADGKGVLSWDGLSNIILWDVGRGKPRWRRKAPYSKLLTLASDGRTALLSLAKPGNPDALFDLQTGEVRQLEHQRLNYYGSRFSPDGRLLVGSDYKRHLLYLVGTRPGQPPRALHARAIYGLSLFSPDGHTLAHVDDRGDIIQLFDVPSGRERGHFVSDQGVIRDLAFSPDGRQLVSAGSNSTALVWDVGAARPPAVVVRTTAELESLWDRLAEDDPETCYAALWDLVASGNQAVDFLKKQLKPIPMADAGRMKQLIQDLDSNEFRTRERALAELERLGLSAEAALKEVLSHSNSAEVRRQARRLLAKSQLTQTMKEREARALEVLDHIGSRAAIALLKELAGGSADAPLTRAARAALERIDKEPGQK